MNTRIYFDDKQDADASGALSLENIHFLNDFSSPNSIRFVRGEGRRVPVISHHFAIINKIQNLQ